MDRIPILKLGDFLLVTIQVDMHDRLAMTLQDDLTARVVQDKARGVLIDISSLEMVDSFIGPGRWAPKPWSWACGRPWRSLLWSWGFPCMTSTPRSTWTKAWNCSGP